MDVEAAGVRVRSMDPNAQPQRMTPPEEMVDLLRGILAEVEEINRKLGDRKERLSDPEPQPRTQW